MVTVPLVEDASGTGITVFQLGAAERGAANGRALLNCRVIESLDSDQHRFRAVAPNDGADWLAAVANEYVELRTRCALPLEDISVDGIKVVSAEHLRERLKNTTIPPHTTGNFSVVRSDFGETLCYMLLEQDYNTRFGYKGVSDRELIQLPGRGIDAVGVEAGNPLTLVLGEVKVSNENASPPRVVD